MKNYEEFQNTERKNRTDRCIATIAPSISEISMAFVMFKKKLITIFKERT